MEIISGFAKNVQLKTPRSFNVRPTTIRARCALFDSLGSFEGLKVLDLFAGSGAMGLEAASRGASEVTLVESAPEHCRFIRTNVEKVEQRGGECKYNIIKSDVISLLKSGRMGKKEFDIIFVDPPYADSARCFKIITSEKSFRLDQPNALMVWEIPDKKNKSVEFLFSGEWNVKNRRKFAGTDFLILN